MRIIGALDASPVDPLEKHRELRRRELDTAVRRLWLHKATAFKALRKQTKPVPAPPQNLHSIPGSTAEALALPHLLHGKETRVWGGQSYRGQRAVMRD